MFQSAFDQLIGPRGCWHPASRASTTHFPTCNAHHTNRQSRGMPLPYGKEGTPFIYFTPMHLPFLVRKQAYNTLAKSESGPAAQREPVMHLYRSLHDCLAVPVFCQYGCLPSRTQAAPVSRLSPAIFLWYFFHPTLRALFWGPHTAKGGSAAMETEMNQRKMGQERFCIQFPEALVFEIALNISFFYRC